MPISPYRHLTYEEGSPQGPTYNHDSIPRQQAPKLRDNYGDYPTLAMLTAAATRAGYSGKRGSRFIEQMVAWLHDHPDPAREAIRRALAEG